MTTLQPQPVNYTGTEYSQERAKRRGRWKVILSAALAAVSIGALSYTVVSLVSGLRKPTVVDLAREQNHLKMLNLWGRVWPPLSVILVGLFVLFLIALGLKCLRWLDERSRESYARSGSFPVKSHRAWTWLRVARWFWLPAQAVIYHDPNRAAGPTTIYTPTADGSAVAVRQVGAEGISPEQMRVTQGAQLAQIAAAVASGPGSTAAMRQQVSQRLPAVNIYNDMDRPLLSPNLPVVSQIEGSHIERLLREQGELPVTARRAEQGDEAI